MAKKSQQSPKAILSKDKKPKVETKQELLDTWQTVVNKGVLSVSKKFKSNPKSILTESDLKCWLFMELQKYKNKNSYDVHTEVTHYHKHGNKDRKKHFRDLSLLESDKIKENETIWTNNHRGLNKGFLHKGKAIHFELKLVRQPRTEKETSVISDKDIEHLLKYKPDNRKRRFVIIWGSKVENGLDFLKTSFIDAMKKHTSKGISEENKQVLSATDIYLFDRKNIVRAVWNEISGKHDFKIL